MNIRCLVAVTRIAFVAITIHSSVIVMGSDYYVSPAGSDIADGRSAAHAWKTLGRAAWGPLIAGDRMLLSRGGSWHETLTLPVDGQTDHPLVIGAYGNGDRPCIDAADVIDASQWSTVESGNYRCKVSKVPETVWTDKGSSLTSATSLSEMTRKPGSYWSDGQSLYVHAISNSPSASPRFELPGREMCVEISKSHIVLQSIAMCHACRVDRGAVTVWADHDLTDIQFKDCVIRDNCGRGAWFCGPVAQSIHDVVIDNNAFWNNDGSGVMLTLADGGEIRGNIFSSNCRKPLEAWQAGIRLWSSGISHLLISDNQISDERWGHDRDSAMGIHCDETSEKITIKSNVIKDVDNAGIAVENTKGVVIEKNIVTDCNIGIFINRAGHDHLIKDNVVRQSRSQGLAIQGWLAHGIDAQPEILVEGRLLTRNRFENNQSIGSKWGNLKATGGGEFIDSPLGNIFLNNDLGPERSGFIEWGDHSLNHYAQWPVPNRIPHS